MARHVPGRARAGRRHRRVLRGCPRDPARSARELGVSTRQAADLDVHEHHLGLRLPEQGHRVPQRRRVDPPCRAHGRRARRLPAGDPRPSRGGLARHARARRGRGRARVSRAAGQRALHRRRRARELLRAGGRQRRGAGVQLDDGARGGGPRQGRWWSPGTCTTAAAGSPSTSTSRATSRRVIAEGVPSSPPEQVELARRYAYAYFFRLMTPIPGVLRQTSYSFAEVRGAGRPRAGGRSLPGPDLRSHPGRRAPLHAAGSGARAGAVSGSLASPLDRATRLDLDPVTAARIVPGMGPAVRGGTAAAAPVRPAGAPRPGRPRGRHLAGVPPAGAGAGRGPRGGRGGRGLRAGPRASGAQRSRLGRVRGGGPGLRALHGARRAVGRGHVGGLQLRERHRAPTSWSPT